MRNVLLLSSGSKVSVARIAARSTKKRGISLHALDRSANVPTIHFVDFFKAIDDENWINPLFQYCIEKKIGLIIPSRHGDLIPLAQEKHRFSNQNIHIGISSLESIKLCIDKYSTYKFLTQNGFPTPKTIPLPIDSLELLVPQLPLVLKPIRGSASKGIRIVNNISEITRRYSNSDNYIAQSLAHGSEYTINVYVSKNGKCLCAIPHKRVIVDGGESVQAITERNPTLINLATQVASALPGAWGPLNIQAFYDSSSDSAQIIEINPRIGGGFPLADEAKGQYIEWLIQESLENRDLKPLKSWTSGLRMMRYRDAIFDHPS